MHFIVEYATVGYMAKRIQMRKNRYLTIQKNNEAKKPEPVRQQGNFKNDSVNLKIFIPAKLFWLTF